MTTIPVLDKGYVRLRDVMGTDLTVVNAARVSFDKVSDWHVEIERSPYGTNGDSEVRRSLKKSDAGLIHFLAREGHWSPFAHPKVSIEVKAPLLVVNQWYRTAVDSVYAGEMHAWNEVSRRYVQEEPEFYIPQVWRAAPENRKQGSGAAFDTGMNEELTEQLERFVTIAQGHYGILVDNGVAPEQARLFLPAYAMYSRFYWTCSLSTVARWLKERLDSHAQWEIRQYAQAVKQLVTPLFPESMDALLGKEGA